MKSPRQSTRSASRSPGFNGRRASSLACTSLSMMTFIGHCLDGLLNVAAWFKMQSAAGLGDRDVPYDAFLRIRLLQEFHSGSGGQLTDALPGQIDIGDGFGAGNIVNARRRCLDTDRG